MAYKNLCFAATGDPGSFVGQGVRQVANPGADGRRRTTVTPFHELPRRARAYLLGVVALGAGALAWALTAAPPPARGPASLFILLAIGAGLVRVPLPVGGTLSPAYAFVLATLMSFGLGASVVAAFASAVVMSLVPSFGHRPPPLHQVAFNAGCVVLASASSGALYLLLGGPVGELDPLRHAGVTLAAAAGFSVLNLGLISLAIRLAEPGEAVPSLRANFVWSVPSFLASASFAMLLALLVQHEHLGSLLFAAPFVYLMHSAYRARARQAEEEKRHSQETAEHYRAVTEALALAIEAKDENTEDHLRRVQVFCAATGRALGLPPAEMKALEAASLLHDIGKIAVPEHILTKPGRLTPDEYEKMKVHPGVGAEILAAVPFPFPLAPIVRHHHERWDGKGYPDALSGEAIPIGARVLSVADCFDALTSDRPYRKALPAEEALEFLRRESGNMFDPAVVRIFLADPEIALAVRRECGATGSRTAVAEERASREPRPDTPGDVPPAIGEARRAEALALQELARAVGRHLDLEENLTLLAARIERLIPHRSLVVYLYDREREHLVARFTTGQGAARLRGLVIPVGDRLAGWSALYRRTYAGSAHVRPLERDGSRSDLEDMSDDPEVRDLRSTIVTPLVTGFEDLGVLALYHTSDRAYGAGEARLVETAAGFVARAIAGSLDARSPAESLTDPVTGVPNSRFFFVESGYRIDRASRDGSAFGVIGLRLAVLDDVHDTLGPTASARVLAQAARRLAAASRPGETLVRFGGNLFLILTSLGTPAALERRAQAILADALAGPVEARFGISQPIDLQVAFACFPFDGSTTEQMLDAIEKRLHPEDGVARAFPSPSERQVPADSVIPDVV